MKRYIKSGNPDLLKKIIDAMFSEQDNFAFEFLGLAIKEFDMDFSPNPLIKDKEAKNIRCNKPESSGQASGVCL